jgi:predicted acyl esterase
VTFFRAHHCLRVAFPLPPCLKERGCSPAWPSAARLGSADGKLDARRSLPYRPYHTHDERQPLTAGAVYELDVEVWPTCIVVPPGYRVSLSVRGRDYEYAGALSDFARSFHYASRGVGPFTHNDPDDRPREVFGGRVTVHAGGRHGSYLLLPIIPS